MTLMDGLLLAALIVVTLAAFVALDRRDKRHADQLSRLLVHVQAPREAVARELAVPSGAPLYLPPEDDKAWNELHRPGD